MGDYGIFEVIGPIMVGPSSSHTAGACRIGNVARKICGEGFIKAEFYLHGSFGSTYRGHGTDRALVAGVLGFSPKDPNLVHAFSFAKKEKLLYEFYEKDLGDVHPNTVKIVLKYPDNSQKEVMGSSIGGGNIHIIEIEGRSLLFKNQFPTIVLQYEEQKGIIAEVSKTLSEEGYNIEGINTAKKGNFVTLTLEITQSLNKDIVNKILNNPKFHFAKYLEPTK
ncbi:MAG: L-serine ammonia-lyase, iron-sulfur-dependent subunit beta [Tissierellia bacterium]|nr:L-serine ammonia-lyase, iron-sulfur-dependent subunit beta [Tissierellia bacterium]